MCTPFPHQFKSYHGVYIIYELFISTMTKSYYYKTVLNSVSGGDLISLFPFKTKRICVKVGDLPEIFLLNIL